jgi:hypothetical protein
MRFRELEYWAQCFCEPDVTISAHPRRRWSGDKEGKELSLPKREGTDDEGEEYAQDLAAIHLSISNQSSTVPECETVTGKYNEHHGSDSKTGDDPFPDSLSIGMAKSFLISFGLARLTTKGDDSANGGYGLFGDRTGFGVTTLTISTSLSNGSRHDNLANY